MPNYTEPELVQIRDLLVEIRDLLAELVKQIERQEIWGK